MKILLVKFKHPHIAVFCQPLGPMYLSSVIKQSYPDADIRLLNLFFSKEPEDDFRKVVSEWRPDVICATVLATDMPALNKCADIAKAIDKNISFICGGPFPTSCFEDFAGITTIDGLVKGEGEEAIKKIIPYYASGTKPVSDLDAGISFRDGTGTLAEPACAPQIEDLDALPYPDWSLVDIDAYSNKPNVINFLAGRRYMSVFTSRGCPFHCTYCHKTFGKNIRFRSEESVLEEFRVLKKDYNIDEIFVLDDTFNVDRKRMINICDAMIREKMNLHFSLVAVRGDLLDEEMIVKYKEAGGYCLSISIETASPRMQKAIKKNLNIEKSIEAIKIARKHGLITKSYFMLGFPDETMEEMMATIKLAKSLPLHQATFNVVTPFKGSELYDQIKEKHGAEFAQKFDNHDVLSKESYYYLTTGVNVQKIQKKAILSFYLHPLRFIRLFIKMPNKAFYLKQMQANISYLIGIKSK